VGAGVGTLNDLWGVWWIVLPLLAVSTLLLIMWLLDGYPSTGSRWRLYSRLCLISGGVAVLLWCYGVAKPNNLEISEGCLSQGGSWDPEYNYAHRDKDNRLFPVSMSCSAEFNAVPGWLNPAVAVFTVLSMAGGMGVVVSAAETRAGQKAGDGTDPPEDQPVGANDRAERKVDHDRG
jgi:hypothetical protein